MFPTDPSRTRYAHDAVATVTALSQTLGSAPTMRLVPLSLDLDPEPTTRPLRHAAPSAVRQRPAARAHHPVTGFAVQADRTEPPRRRRIDLRLWLARLVWLVMVLPRLPRRDIASGRGPGLPAATVGRWLTSVADLVEGLAGQGLGLAWIGPSEVVRRGGRPALRSARLVGPLGRPATVRSDHVLPPEAWATGVCPGTPAATAWCAGATALWLAGRAPRAPAWGQRVPAAAWWAAARRWQEERASHENDLAAVVEALLRPAQHERMTLVDVGWWLDRDQDMGPGAAGRAA